VRVREGRVEVWRGSTKLQTLSAGDAWSEGEEVHALAEAELRGVLEPLGEPMPKVETAVVTPPEAPVVEQPVAAKEESVDAGERERNADQWLKACSVHGKPAATAEREMEAHLKSAPRDAETWHLLGQCYGSANPKAARNAYKKAMQYGSPAQANAARLGLAEIDEKLLDFKAVKELMQTYLSKPAATHVGEAEASAMIKLAHAQMALGETDDAKATLQLLIKKHPRSPLAAEAHSQLQAL